MVVNRRHTRSQDTVSSLLAADMANRRHTRSQGMVSSLLAADMANRRHTLSLDTASHRQVVDTHPRQVAPVSPNPVVMGHRLQVDTATRRQAATDNLLNSAFSVRKRLRRKR
jgi:hypothetical protein